MRLKINQSIFNYSYKKNIVSHTLISYNFLKLFHSCTDNKHDILIKVAKELTHKWIKNYIRPRCPKNILQSFKFDKQAKKTSKQIKLSIFVASGQTDYIRDHPLNYL